MKRLWRRLTALPRFLWNLLVGLKELVGLVSFGYIVYWITSEWASQPPGWGLIIAVIALAAAVYASEEERT